MTEDQLKPAASLTADRIRRAPAPIGPADDLTVPDPPSDGSSWGLEEERRGLLTWRRAGLFGLIYVGALLVFAAVFDVWPTLEP